MTTPLSMRRPCAAILLGLVIATGGARPAMSDSFGLAAPATPSGAPMNFWGTAYFVYRAKAVPGGIPMLGAGGPLGITLSRSSWCNAALEGTVTVDTPGGRRTFNHAGLSDGPQATCAGELPSLTGGARSSIERVLFKAVPKDAPYGLGSDPRYRLVPYRSVAVDPSAVRLGTALYLPALDGVRLPNGQTHDGYVFAADTGAGVNGRHLDFFTGLDGPQARGVFNGNSGSTIKAFPVSDPAVLGYLRQLHLR